MLSFHLSINVIIIVVSFKILDLCPIALFQQLWNTLYLRHQAYTLYYRHVCILVFLHVFAHCMLLRCMLKFKRLLGVTTLLNTIQYQYNINVCNSVRIVQLNTTNVFPRCRDHMFRYIFLTKRRSPLENCAMAHRLRNTSWAPLKGKVFFAVRLTDCSSVVSCNRTPLLFLKL